MQNPPQTQIDTVLFDVDGTLIDSNYWHVAAWQQAFAEIGSWQPAWRLHTCIGMGGDKLVAAVGGDEIEERSGDALRAAWKSKYDELIGNVRAFPGAGELLEAVKARGFSVVLASSGSPEHLKIARGLLDADEVIDAVTTGEDVEASKPSADLFELALKKVGGRNGLVVGDAPWDAEAAGLLSLPVLGLRCGGFAQSTLLDAGAAAVYDDPADLLAQFADTALAVSPR